MFVVVDLTLFVDGLYGENTHTHTGLDVVCVCVCETWPRPRRHRTDRADVQGEDEDDEEAQVPGEQRAEQNHALLLPEVAIAMQQEQRQEEDHHDLDAEGGAAHPDGLVQRPCGGGKIINI